MANTMGNPGSTTSPPTAQDSTSASSLTGALETPLPPVRQRLSLHFSNPFSTSPACCLIFTGPLCSRMQKDLLREDERFWYERHPEDFDHLIDDELNDLQCDASAALRESIYQALLAHDPFPAKLEAQLWEEVRKRPAHLKPVEEEGREPASERICELNDRWYGLSAIYMKTFPGDCRDSAPYVEFLYIAGPASRIEMQYDEEGLENVICILRYRLEITEMADRYLDFMQLPLPNGKTCREYDRVKEEDSKEFKRRQFAFKCRKYEIQRREAEMDDYLPIEKEVKGLQLFPLPSKREGGVRLQFSKPSFYFYRAKFHFDISDEEYSERMKALENAFLAELDRIVAWLKTLPDVREKAQEIFELCGANASGKYIF